MKFTDCNFSACRKVKFSCVDCSHYDPNGVSGVMNLIHPILGIPMSCVPTNIRPDGLSFLEGELLPIEVKDTLLFSPVQLEIDFKD